MTFEFQIVVDSADPHSQADWWAEAMGWAVEPSNEGFIRQMVEQGHATDADTKHHKGVLVWREGQAINHPDVPGGDGVRRRILFQFVPEVKSVKNRLHFDLRVGKDNVEAEVKRLTDLGATFLHRGEQGPTRWVTMVDPEGNEFCVS